MWEKFLGKEEMFENCSFINNLAKNRRAIKKYF